MLLGACVPGSNATICSLGKYRDVLRVSEGGEAAVRESRTMCRRVANNSTRDDVS